MVLKLKQFDLNLLLRTVLDWMLFTINGIYISDTILGGACIFW
jgi:hypothetical protein